MRTLSQKEWIAITVGLVIVIFFMGARFFMNFSGTPSTSSVVDSSQNGLDASSTTGVSTSTINNSNQNTKPMDQNTSKKPSTVNGPVITDVLVGTGAEAKSGDVVSVHYTGRFADGKVFDSSVSRGQPFQFTLGAGMVIKGWDVGVVGMKVGGKRTLQIPPDFGYGANGYPPVIPPNATLYFDIELLGVQKQ